MTPSRIQSGAGPSPERVAAVRAALAAVVGRIESAGGDPRRVTVVGVTKGHPPEAVSAALEAGLTDLGENYAAELAAKAGASESSDPAARWHFLGRIQRNKVNVLSPLVSIWQTVERPEEARSLARAHQTGGGTGRAAVMVQVRLAGDGRRGGCPPDALEELVALCRPLVDVVGLMAVGPAGSPETARPGFRWLAGRAADLGLAQVSMGMSADLEVAVAEGSTMVRVGTGLFGPRPKSADLGR
jgi:PLP dependent protein